MTDVRPAVDGFVLVGGASRRMGRDKADLPFAGSTLAASIAESMRPLVRSVSAVGRAGSVGPLTSVPDVRPGLGPLAGIETALTISNGASALVVACDLPLVSRELLALLLECAAANPESIVVASASDGRVSPVCGVYPHAALATISDLLDRGVRSPQRLLETCRTAVIGYPQYEHLRSSGDLLRNVNTPEEYERLLGGGDER